MTEQAIPQNITLETLHLLSVSPIEFKRNSSLIANKLNKLDKSYENYDDLRDQSILNDKNNIIDDEILELEKAESRLFELSFNDISGLDDKKVDFSFTSPKVSR